MQTTWQELQMTNCWRYYATATIQELTRFGVNIYMIDSVDNAGTLEQRIIFKPHCYGNPSKKTILGRNHRKMCLLDRNCTWMPFIFISYEAFDITHTL